jgi:hypothetical protein
MILWRLRGYADPEGDFSGGEMTCSIEKSEDGHRLLVEHDGKSNFTRATARWTARGKADVVKTELLTRGFTE